MFQTIRKFCKNRIVGSLHDFRVNCRRPAYLVRLAISFIISVMLVFLFSVLADRTLQFLGFPAEMSVQIAHPRNYVEARTNVEFSYEFKTNSQGLRYREIPLEKDSESNIRFAVVGDSYTEGIGLEVEQRFTNLLEQKLSTDRREVNFINCGLTGTGPLAFGRILFGVCAKYHPDAVLIVLFANDVSDTKPTDRLDVFDPMTIPSYRPKSGVKRIFHTILPRISTLLQTAYLRLRRYAKAHSTRDFVKIVSKQARRRGIPQEKISQWIADLPTDLVDAVNKRKFNGAILSLGLTNPSYWVSSLDLDTQDGEMRWEAVVAILSDTVELSWEKGMWVGIVFAPATFQYDEVHNGRLWKRMGAEVRSEWLTEQSEFETRLQRWAENEGVPILNLTPIFRAEAKKTPGTLHFPLDGHWSPDGNRLAANAIQQWLLQEKTNPLTEASH